MAIVIEPRGERVRISLEVPKEMRNKIQYLATASGRTISDIVRQLLEKSLKE